MNNRTSISKVTPVLFGFFIMAFCDLVGVSVSYAKESFYWTETQSSFLPFMVFFWFLVLSIPAALLMDKIGRKNTVLISMIITFIGLAIPFIHFNETLCLLVFALLGIGNTILQVSLNPLITNVINGDKLASSLTVGQFVKAISSFSGPIIVGFCSIHFGNWTTAFPIYAGITLFSGLWLLFTSIPEKNAENRQSGIKGTVSLLTNKKILILFIGILCIVGLDVGMNTLTPKLLIERVGLSTEEAGYGSSWYFAARTIGTICGAFLLAKMPNSLYFRVNMLIVVLALSGLLLVQTQYAILSTVCIIAFSSSCIFAVIYSMALQLKPDKANEISGLLITGVSGGALFPILMGIASDWIGSQVGSILVVSLTAIFLLICAYSVKIEKQ